MLTIVGIPLALILLALYLIALYLAKIFVFLLIAQLLLHGKGRGWSLLLGLALYEAILLVPFIGWIIALLTFFFGLGALFMKEKEIFTQLKTTEKI
jgi:hypothetical protein